MQMSTQMLLQANFSKTHAGLRQMPEGKTDVEREYIRNRFNDKQGCQNIKFGPGQLGKNVVNKPSLKHMKNDV